MAALHPSYGEVSKMFDASCFVRLVEEIPLMAKGGYGLKEMESCQGVAADLG